MIGSVDTAEFVVAGAASIGFLIGLGSEGFLLPTVAALLIGGLIAAPVAAWLVRIVPAQLLGATIGGVIVLTNARILLKTSDAGSTVRPVVYALLAVGWVVALTLAVRALRRTRQARAIVDAATETGATTADTGATTADRTVPPPLRTPPSTGTAPSRRRRARPDGHRADGTADGHRADRQRPGRGR